MLVKPKTNDRSTGGRQAPGVTIPGMTMAQLVVVLCALLMGTLLAALDLSIVNTALPTIAGKLNGVSGYAWVGTSYILTSTIAMPILGKLSDLYGRQRLFHISIVIFLIASVLCAGAHSIGQLIAARGLQGVGGGGIQAITFAILGDLITPRERGRYIGLYVGAYTVAGISGPLVGGFIVDRWSWPWVFLINIPIGLIALGASIWQLRLPFKRRKTRLDLLGAALLSVALIFLMLGLEEGRKGWGRGRVVGLFVGAAVLVAGFIAQERRAVEPMIPLSLFRNKVCANIYLVSVLIGASVFGTNIFLPLFFQDARGVSPTRSGLYLVPQILGSLVGTIIVGRLIAKTGRYKAFVVVACVVAGVGFLGVARIDADIGYTILAFPLLLAGLGTGAIFTVSSVAMQNSIQRSDRPGDMGVATATQVFFRSLGGSIGLAIFGSLFTERVAATVKSRLGPDVKASTIIRDPKAIAKLDEPTRHAIAVGLGQGARVVFLVVVAIFVVLFFVLQRLRELPLIGGSPAAAATPGH